MTDVIKNDDGTFTLEDGTIKTREEISLMPELPSGFLMLQPDNVVQAYHISELKELLSMHDIEAVMHEHREDDWFSAVFQEFTYQRTVDAMKELLALSSNDWSCLEDSDKEVAKKSIRILRDTFKSIEVNWPEF